MHRTTDLARRDTAKAASTAAYQATGSLAYALIYPIAVPAICFLISLFLMPETKQNSIWEEAAVAKA